MMPFPLPHSWTREFARSAARREEQVRFFRESESERKLKETARDERVDDDFADLALSTVLATDGQIAEFRIKLDDYRAATVESLMENERQLVEVQKRLDDMLAKAYVLPDGRRVFKTEDGLRVFDEHGAELDAEEIDPDEIEDWRPHAEGYLEDRVHQRDLMTDRDRKLDFLDRVDAAEARVDDRDLTDEDVKEMERELDAYAPPDIRNRLSGGEPHKTADVGRDFGAAARLVPDVAGLKLDMPEFGR